MISQPWMKNDSIEFFADNGKAYCIEQGTIVPFAQISISTYKIIAEDFAKHPKIKKAMQAAGIYDAMEQLEHYVICRYGVFNKTPDFIANRNMPQDQEDVQIHCGNHRCKMRGILCASMHNLTEREVTICKLVGSGLSDKEIAARLYLATVTVSTHITNILHKLHMSSRSAIAAFAVLNDLLESNRVPQRS